MCLVNEVRQGKTNTARYHLYVESEKYKLVNITKNRHRYIEQTSGYQCWGGNIGVEEWEIPTIECKIDSRRYYTI